MVDYTKKTMRDETWRRWKGGKKLANELRNFYTAKHVFDRQAALNPATPGPPAANGEFHQTRRVSELLRRSRYGDGRSQVRNNLMRIARQRWAKP